MAIKDPALTHTARRDDSIAIGSAALLVLRTHLEKVGSECSNTGMSRSCAFIADERVACMRTYPYVNPRNPFSEEGEHHHWVRSVGGVPGWNPREGKHLIVSLSHQN